ncbi:MAG: FAD-dependent oxidoreductase [Mariprofundus sp.]|nr:FAD-dependent oxidoreductase [Mariprofundus sp.]
MNQSDNMLHPNKQTGHKVAIIGAGLTGLTAAIRLAEQGVQVHLFEASAKAGGRTRSFYEKQVDCLCDNGPHLLVGAYQATRKLLIDCNIAHHVTWQPNLQLPLWHQQRGTFAFKPKAWLPIQLALLNAASALPGHGKPSAIAMIKLASTFRDKMHESCTVKAWMMRISMPQLLIDDLIEPLCLGAMNEHIDTANALSFRQVLRESFSSHQQARLGWFNRPLDEALIQPLIEQAEKLGVSIYTRSSVRSLQVEHKHNKNSPQIDIQGHDFDSAIIALPAYATDRLLGQNSTCETRVICNIHLWFDQEFSFPSPFIGGLGTTGQWFFDISSQMIGPSHQQGALRHLCAIISADQRNIDDRTLVQIIRDEIRHIADNQTLNPVHYRIIREKRATVLVRQQQTGQVLPDALIDASERPKPGQLPATIESAVQRGEKAALLCLSRLNL